MSNNENLTCDQIMNLIDSSDKINSREKIELKIRTFYKFIEWCDDDYLQYDKLLKDLKDVKKKNKVKTKELGDALEKLVNFIFEKSFFYKVHPNKRTSTNEIDQFITLTDKGKQALNEYKFSQDLLMNKENYLLCECKNYNDKVASTWVGKFNTLLDSCGDCSLGILFSYHGLTGKENNWYDAHGLTKIIYRITKSARERFIIDFNINDFEKLKNKDLNLFKLIDSKKKALLAGVQSEKLYDEVHDGIEEVKILYEEICK